MDRRKITLICGIGALALFLGACSLTPWPSGSKALEPYMAGAPEAEAVTLQEPFEVGLVWLEPGQGTATLPERAERTTIEAIRSHFGEGAKLIHVVRVDKVSSVSPDTLRELGRSHGLRNLLVVAPTVKELELAAHLRYGRGGYGVGTRTETFVLLEAVGVDLETGSPMFAARGNGVASLEELDYGPLGPWYPRISRGVDLAGLGGFIYPNGEEFPPDEVRAVAMKDAVAVLLADLDRVGKSENS